MTPPSSRMGEKEVRHHVERAMGNFAMHFAESEPFWELGEAMYKNESSSGGTVPKTIQVERDECIKATDEIMSLISLAKQEARREMAEELKTAIKVWVKSDGHAYSCTAHSEGQRCCLDTEHSKSVQKIIDETLTRSNQEPTDLFLEKIKEHMEHSPLHFKNINDTIFDPHLVEGEGKP